MKFTFEDILNAVARLKQEKVENNQYEYIIQKDDWHALLYKIEGFGTELREKLVHPTNTNSIPVYDFIKEILG